MPRKGHIAKRTTEADPVRAVAARRLAGMGVDIDAADEWLQSYSADWVHPGDAGGRRLARLGGSEPGLKAPPRRRPAPA